MEKEQARPLTSTPCSPQTTNTDEVDSWSFLVRLCGCCTAVAAVLGLTMLILAFTLIKIKNPILILNTISTNNLKIFLTPNHPISINVTLIADISIKNPNAASIQLDTSVTKFYYVGETVGVAYSPQTKVLADRTMRMNVTVDVLAGNMAVLTNVTGSVMSRGYMNLTSSTDVRGRVSVFGVFKRGVGVVMNCSMSLKLDVALLSQQVKYGVCQAYVQ